MEGGSDPDRASSYTRLRRLQAISEAALAHLRFDELLNELLRRLTSILGADTAAVLLLDEEANELVARAAKGLEEEVEQGTRIPVGRGFAGRIAAERRPITILDVEHADILNPLLREKGIRSLMGVPLVVEGAVTGVLHVGSLTKREFSAEDVELLQLAADRVAVAIDHARLYEAEREARQAAERMASQIARVESISEVGLSHLSVDEAVLQSLLARVREVLGVDAASVLVMDDEEQTLVARAAEGLEEEVERGVRVPLGRGFAGRVAELRAPLVVDDVSETEVISPLLREMGVRSMLGVPLIVEERVLGVLHVASFEPRHFTADDLALMSLAGDRLALALDQSRLYERERRVAETLQRSLLPERLPDVPRAKIAARYTAGSIEADVGGDWYDVIPLPGGGVAFAMGDVVSRGIRAAAVMGQLRNALRAYALEGYTPAALLERLDAMLQTIVRREMATLLYLVLDPLALTYTLASAGHPPPLRIDADGTLEYLEEGRSPPLGATSEPIPRSEATGELSPGSTLLLYTDGLVERRDMWIEQGLERLMLEARAAADLGPDELLDRLLGRMLPPGGADDDVALLGIALESQPSERLSLRLPAEPGVLSAMRRTLRRWLEELGATVDESYDVLVATTEAAANAVEHAYGPVHATFDIEAAAVADGVEIVVRDQGRWRPPRGQNRGRGTLLMQELMDHFEVSTGDDGTVVRMQRRVARAAALV